MFVGECSSNMNASEDEFVEGQDESVDGGDESIEDMDTSIEARKKYHNHVIFVFNGPLTRYANYGLRMRRECRELFPTNFKVNC